MIPQGIKSEHILKAIEEIERSGIPRDRHSDRYVLEYNKKLYPPKYIISLANKYANGKELDHSEFTGGDEANNFLRSQGFNIIDKEPTTIDDGYVERQTNDFAPRLRDYLENIYSIKIEKGIGRAHLLLPSGAVLHIRGSIMLKGQRGFYYLQEEDYHDILGSSNKFLAIVFGDPEKTFVFPKDSLKTFFDGLSLNLREGKKPKWYFDIREDNGRHYLKVHSHGAQQQNIDNYINKWDQIEDFKRLDEEFLKGSNPNHWILVVTDKPVQDLTAKQILTTRINDKFWGLNARTPYRTLLRKEDRVIFSYGAKELLGTATLNSDPFELTEEQRNQFSHSKEFFKADFGVMLTDIELWDKPKPLQQCINILPFIKNKTHYMTYFQGGIRKITKEDYNNILDISPSHHNDIVSFVDLQKFLLEEMHMQANYQPIMIRTLLQSGGRATREAIAGKIKELNPEIANQDFKNVPVYDVLEKHGVVRKNNNEFILNAVQLTEDQTSQLIALCNWKTLNLPLQLDELIYAFDKNKSLFDPNHITLDEREKLRSSFISDFQVDKILDMKLEDYVTRDPRSNQVNKRSFCYRLEEELGVLSGIGGIPAKKFGIYFNKKSHDYEYNKLKYDSPQKAFDDIKSEIYTILEAGRRLNEDQDWNHLSEILERNYNIYRLVRSKILSLYYPDSFIQIHSADKLQDILKAFGKPTNNIQDKLFLLQKRLLEVKNTHPVMEQWHNEDFSHFAWNAIIERNKKEDDDRPTDDYDESVLQVYKDVINNKDTLYQRIRQECTNRNLTFKDISEEIRTGVEYGFIISNEETEVKIYGNILSNKMEGDTVYQAIRKSLYDFYKLNKCKNFVIIIDSVQNHFLTIPFNFLKNVMYDRESGNDINKTFHIARNPYTLQRNKASLSQYVDNLDVLFALNDVIARTNYTIEEIERIERRLIDKGQIIFYGPPGTGKTHVALAFGEYFTGSKDNVEVIQFHPSYSYEDFVEGIRPNDSGGFSKRPGIFKRFVDEKCSQNRDKRFLLVIDEINRGDIARIFGELTHLLLNRDKEITLAYSSTVEDKFSVPSNLYIIATMNSQDRSIAFLDYANRRRFSWMKFEPRYDILSSWLDKNSDLTDKAVVLDALKAINEIIMTKLGEDYEMGHSYFMEDKLDKQKLKDIIEYELKPLTKQYFFAKKDEEFLTKINQYFDIIEAQS